TKLDPGGELPTCQNSPPSEMRREMLAQRAHQQGKPLAAVFAHRRGDVPRMKCRSRIVASLFGPLGTRQRLQIPVRMMEESWPPATLRYSAIHEFRRPKRARVALEASPHRNSATRDRTTSKEERLCIIRAGPYERFERSFPRKVMPVETLLGDSAQ